MYITLCWVKSFPFICGVRGRLGLNSGLSSLASRLLQLISLSSISLFLSFCLLPEQHPPSTHIVLLVNLCPGLSILSIQANHSHTPFLTCKKINITPCITCSDRFLFLKWRIRNITALGSKVFITSLVWTWTKPCNHNNNKQVICNLPGVIKYNNHSNLIW